MDERIEELFPLYALGGLTQNERDQVDVYLDAHPEAWARLAEFTAAAQAVPFAVAPVAPPERVKQALINRVRADARAASEERAPPPRRSGFVAALFRPMPLLTAGSLVVAVLAGVWAFSLNGEVARLREETTALRNELVAQRDVLATLSRPGVQALTLAGTEHQPSAHGQLLADPQAQSGVLVVGGLAPLPEGEVYQFWLIRGDQPVSAGIFTVDAQGRAVLDIAANQFVGSFDAMGVSIEPEGGSPLPTGDIVMLSTLS